MRRKPALLIACVLWALEWIFGWSSYLGTLGTGIAILSLIALGYLVIESRSGRLPRTLHTWLWMSALLVITVIRAAWWGRDGGAFSQWARQVPIPVPDHVDAKALQSMLAAAMTGLTVGLIGAFEAVIIGVMTWIGDVLRPADNLPRTPFWARLAVVILQAPIFVVAMLWGLALVGGGAAQSSLIALGAGALLWALAVVHFDRLLALPRGHWMTRAVLALYAIAAAAVVFLEEASVSRGIGTAVWLVLQLAAIRAARPRRRVAHRVRCSRIDR